MHISDSECWTFFFIYLLAICTPSFENCQLISCAVYFCLWLCSVILSCFAFSLSCFLSSCCDEIPWQKQFRGAGVWLMDQISNVCKPLRELVTSHPQSERESKEWMHAAIGLFLTFHSDQSPEHDILLPVTSVGLPTLIIPIKISPNRHPHEPARPKQYLIKVFFLDDYRLCQLDCWN